MMNTAAWMAWTLVVVGSLIVWNFQEPIVLVTWTLVIIGSLTALHFYQQDKEEELKKHGAS